MNREPNLLRCALPTDPVSPWSFVICAGKALVCRPCATARRPRSRDPHAERTHLLEKGWYCFSILGSEKQTR